MRILAVIALLGGCYTGARAARDVNESWRGRTRAEIEARWGRAAVSADGALVWSHARRHVDASAGARVAIEPGAIDAAGHLEARAWTTTTEVVARLDGDRIAQVEGPSLRWGPPRDANLRWGTLLGVHAGMGRLDDTASWLPGGSVYIGGMLSPTLGLVGVYSLASGSDDEGGAIAMSAGIAAQWWPLARVWLRGGPAGVLDFDPGFDDASLSPGVTTGASYALIRGRAFVLDLRVDATVSPSAGFATLGVGANLN